MHAPTDVLNYILSSHYMTSDLVSNNTVNIDLFHLSVHSI